MISWLDISEDSDFSIHNIPFGIFKPKSNSNSERVGVRLGDYVIDLYELAQSGFLNTINFDKSVLQRRYLNDFISLGKVVTNAIRNRIAELFSSEKNELRDNDYLKEKIIHKIENVQVLLPVKVGNYTDFYSSKEHATNVGTMFRGKENALNPNWKHLPIAYHGRASSIVVSGTPIKRPKGQIKPPDATEPIFSPTRQLDFELEMAFIVGKETELGNTISTADAEDYIFGFVLFNDWSARDIQLWEYVPLGPFLAKNFASSISPWVVTLEALKAFQVPGPGQDPEPLPYLQFHGNKNFDLQLEVYLKSANSQDQRISKSNFKYLYWNICQQLAHHTINGCNVQVGDVMASGTISGSDPDSYGSMLELTWRGNNPIQLSDGTERKFIEDGDILTMKGFAEKDGIRVGFGEVTGRIISNT